MAEILKNKSLFIVEFYDVGSGFKKDEDWKRYRHAYVISSDMESAQKIAAKNCAENEVLIGVREQLDSIVYSD